MEYSHLNLDLPFFLLPSGWKKVIFMLDTLSSILAIWPNYFNLAILIIFTMLGSLYKLYSSSLYIIIHHYVLYSPYPIDTTWAINLP